MDILELENRVAKIRSKPLLLVCVLPTGKAQSMTVRQCWESGSRYLHVDCTEIDEVLGVALGGDKEYP